MRSMRRAAGGLLTAAVFLTWLPQQGCGSGDEQVATPAPPDQRACLALPARSYTGEVACLPLDDDDEHAVGELRTIWGEQPSSIGAYQPGVVELTKCVPFLVPYVNAFCCGVDDFILDIPCGTEVAALFSSLIETTKLCASSRSTTSSLPWGPRSPSPATVLLRQDLT